jgi:hypothetical protein
MASTRDRPIRIAGSLHSIDVQQNGQMTLSGCSGAATDRRHAMAMLAANHPNDPVDVIMGDW